MAPPGRPQNPWSPTCANGSAVSPVWGKETTFLLTSSNLWHQDVVFLTEASRPRTRPPKPIIRVRGRHPLDTTANLRHVTRAKCKSPETAMADESVADAATRGGQRRIEHMHTGHRSLRQAGGKHPCPPDRYNELRADLSHVVLAAKSIPSHVVLAA